MFLSMEREEWDKLVWELQGRGFAIQELDIVQRTQLTTMSTRFVLRWYRDEGDKSVPNGDEREAEEETKSSTKLSHLSVKIKMKL